MNIGASRLISVCKPALNIPTRLNSQWKLMHYYNTLKARPDDAPDEIRANYLELIKIYHPDNPETGDPKKFMRIQNSYDKIKAAPLWQKGTDAVSECMTHEQLIKTRMINKNEHKVRTQYTTRHFTLKLYKKA